MDAETRQQVLELAWYVEDRFNVLVGGQRANVPELLEVLEQLTRVIAELDTSTPS